MALIPNYPMVNLGDLYVQGGRMAYVTGATHTFTVTAGQFRDQSNTNDIILAATTPSLLVSGLNGIDTGSVAASTVYYVYAVGSSVYGANDGQDAGAPQGVGLLRELPLPFRQEHIQRLMYQQVFYYLLLCRVLDLHYPLTMICGVVLVLSEPPLAH